MRIQLNRIIISFCCLLVACMQLSCKKLISIDGPKNTITTTQVFNTQSQAESALAGVYTRMINGENPQNISEATINIWSAGAIRLFAGFSSGEIYNSGGTARGEYYYFTTNKLTLFNSLSSDEIWKTAYTTIYGANSIIEGIAASTSSGLLENVRKELTAEAKFIRAFTYFYLTNLYGDVPLALTVDFNRTVNMQRTAQQLVYDQIVADLKDAKEALRPDYSAGLDERIRPNKWAATALLARVYLYRKDYAKAAAAATEVIDENTLYGLEPDLNNSFLTVSREAIWQLKQTDESPILNGATPEGFISIPPDPFVGVADFYLSDQLMDAFEPGDKRRRDWVDSTFYAPPSGPAAAHFYPTKYKIGRTNSSGMPAEYYMMLRFSEMYLVRAEANANGAPGGLPDAIADLNMIRHRAGLDDLPVTFTKDQVLAAVEQERQVELFAEWGHRWFDLKRTSRASAVLQTFPLKLPWAGDFQLLYPIPTSEIRDDHFLTQNPGYF